VHWSTSKRVAVLYTVARRIGTARITDLRAVDIIALDTGLRAIFAPLADLLVADRPAGGTRILVGFAVAVIINFVADDIFVGPVGRVMVSERRIIALKPGSSLTRCPCALARSFLIITQRALEPLIDLAVAVVVLAIAGLLGEFTAEAASVRRTTLTVFAFSTCAVRIGLAGLTVGTGSAGSSAIAPRLTAVLDAISTADTLATAAALR
jgi:hypothetical protein